jgi:threonine dehydrogenase-like Zn-dependent dehydrogenase
LEVEMKATCFFGNSDIRVEELPEPTIERPTDALVRVTLSSICGSDLHYYHAGEQLGFLPGMRTGHEFLGTVEAVGSEVTDFRPGDRVLGHPLPVDGTCRYCKEKTFPCAFGPGAFGFSSAFWPYGGDIQGCQSEMVRVPFAGGTLTSMPAAASGPEHELALLTCVDNLATGWHAAVTAGVTAGQDVLVIGDGGVGLCAVVSAAVKGAAQIICLGHHDDRLAVAERLGATELINSREKDEIAARVLELTGGEGAHAVLQTISGEEPMAISQACARRCGVVSCVGMEQFVGKVPGIDWVDQWIRNITITGGLVPGPHYTAELAGLVADGRVDPSPIFTHTLPLERAPEGYRMMAERADGVIKVALTPGG